MIAKECLLGKSGGEHMKVENERCIWTLMLKLLADFLLYSLLHFWELVIMLSHVNFSD